jgi:hypothetical protein
LLILVQLTPGDNWPDQGRPGHVMEEKFWRLRYKAAGHSPNGIGEQTFHTESGFKLGLQTAYRDLATDIVGTRPDGSILTEALLRRQYPPE